MPAPIKQLVDRMPAPQPDERGILSKVDRAATLEALAELHAGGAESVRGLVDLLGEPHADDAHKARYALHGLALYVCGLGDRARNDHDRPTFAAALAATLDDKHPATVKEFVIRELQACGGQEVIPAIGKCLSESALADAAASTLVAIGGPAAAAQLRRLLAASEPRLRLIAVQSLGVLRDTESLDGLIAATRDADSQTRVTACWALANVGDPKGVNACLAAAEKAQGYERIQSGKNCLLIAERLADGGHKDAARKVLEHIKKTSTGQSESYLREAADRALVEAK
jgi:HEAT repeat protein